MSRTAAFHCLAIFAWGTLPGAELIVDPSGAAKYRTIQPAIDAAEEGDTVIVKAGEYRDHLRVPQKAITVQSEAGPVETVIRFTPPAGSEAVAVHFSETGDGNGGQADFRGFTVVVESSQRESAAISVSGTASPAIVGCMVVGGILGMTTSGESQPILQDCQVRGNWIALRCSGQSHPTLSGCTLIGGQPNRIGDDEASALRSSGESRADLFHSTLTGGWMGIRSSEESWNTIESCIIAGNPSASIMASGTSGQDVVYSCVAGSEPWPGEGNIHRDPGFCAPGYWYSNGTSDVLSDDVWIEGDYRLSSGSPCRAAGKDGLNMGNLLGECGVAAVLFKRGDVDGDGMIQLNDPIQILDYAFISGIAPGCLDAADTDDSERIDLTDAIYSLAFQFLGGPPPPRPFSGCGSDSDAGVLDCRSPPACR